MTSSALTRPGERSRAIVKFAEIDWTLTAVLCLLAGCGGLMLYSIAGGNLKPWAEPHLFRFGLCLLLMAVLAMVDLRVWFVAAYPVYAIGLLLLVVLVLVLLIHADASLARPGAGPTARSAGNLTHRQISGNHGPSATMAPWHTL